MSMPDERPVITTLKTAARTAAAEGHRKEAVAIFRRLAALIERLIGRDNVEYATCMHELADACYNEQLWTFAEQGYRDALAVYRRWLPDNDPTIVLILRSMADTCRLRGNELEAKRLEHEAASILAKKLRSLQSR